MGSSDSPEKMKAEGPVIQTGVPGPSQVKDKEPPGKWTSVGWPAGTLPDETAATNAAHAPVPQASVNPQPRSCTVS